MPIMAIGPWQIVLIALVVLVLFGASRLGDIGKGLGEGIRNFKKGISSDDDDDVAEAQPPKQLPPGSSSAKGAAKSEEKA